MRLFLAGLEGTSNYDNCKEYINSIIEDTYILTSFYYVKQLKYDWNRINRENLLLDSGAFTFRMHGLKGEDIDKYTDRYIQFINEYDIKYFFEMDIDFDKESYRKVLKLRKRIEEGTGKKCIPVWHDTRGIDGWLDIINNYNYVAIGGITSTDGKKQRIVKKLIKLANKKKVKVHLLGYNRQDLLDYDAYSCDATSWNQGRYGCIWNWDNNNKIPIKGIRDKNKRIISSEQKYIYEHNLKVWVQYQRTLRFKGYWRE